MKEFAKDLTMVFSAGCLGGVTNSLAVWIFGAIGITGLFGVSIAPSFTYEWLYPRIVWGGLWGVLFLLPILKGSCYLRGLVLSLGPSIVMLFIVFPLKAGKGAMGLDLGALTPVFVLIFNAVWGLTATMWLTCVLGRD
jgi:hypothetical protein